MSRDHSPASSSVDAASSQLTTAATETKHRKSAERAKVSRHVYVVYTKAGGVCPYCDDAKALLAEKGKAYDEVVCRSIAQLKDKVYPHVKGVTSFPLIIAPDGRAIGGFEHLRDHLDEPILDHANARWSAFPIQHPDIYALYKQAVACFWTSDEISLKQDKDDFKTLPDQERYFLTHVLAFFAQSDGLVTQNLMDNFTQQVSLCESQLFYTFQAFNESEHNVTYSLLIDTLLEGKEREKAFDAIQSYPAVKKKADWAAQWLDSRKNCFARRLIAFACVEGILFSGSFCAIYWLKQRHPGLLPGVSLSNQFIARDEGLHTVHACMLYRKLRHILPEEEVHRIVESAIDNEIEFITEALPCSLIGMSAASMSQYIKHVGDALLRDLGYSKMYHVTNPFTWMEMMAMDGKTNFFESRVSEYARASVISGEVATVNADDDDF